MKRQLIFLPQYQWHLNIFYDTYKEDIDSVMDALIRLECSEESLERSYENIISNEANMGLTYSNPEFRESLVVLGHADNLGEFLNSAVHEICHIAVHIAQFLDIDTYSEELCYLAGDIAQKMHPLLQPYMCGCKKRGH